MAFWTRALLGTVVAVAVGSGWILANAAEIDVGLVPERKERGRLLVEVDAERVNIYNRPWDGAGHVGGIVGPLLPSIALESPPDMMLCLVNEARTQCHANGSRQEPASYCHDSFRCKWQVDADPAGGFALVIFDLDIVKGRSVSDLIDIVSISSADALPPRLEKRVRALVESIAPTRTKLPSAGTTSGSLSWRPGEARRRARGFPEAPADYCAGACELEQSTIRLGWS